MKELDFKIYGIDEKTYENFVDFAKAYATSRKGTDYALALKLLLKFALFGEKFVVLSSRLDEVELALANHGKLEVSEESCKVRTFGGDLE